MSRQRSKKGGYQNLSSSEPKGSPVWWQSAAMNDIYYEFFRQQIVKLALARFKWVGLPPTCDERFLELTLLTHGVATIARPKSRRDNAFMTLQAVQQGRLNAYGLPAKWNAQGVNGTCFGVSKSNGVLVWENMLHLPLAAQIQHLAWDMSDIMRTKQVNRIHVKVPWIVSGPPEMKNQIVNLFSQKAGNEPAVIVTDKLSDYVKDSTSLMQTGVQYLGKELNDDLMQTWGIVYTLLGIRNLPFKSERMTADEVMDYDQPTELTALGELDERRRAADELNRRFGLDVRVVFNSDFQSENFAVLNSVKKLSEVGLLPAQQPIAPEAETSASNGGAA